MNSQSPPSLEPAPFILSLLLFPAPLLLPPPSSFPSSPLPPSLPPLPFTPDDHTLVSLPSLHEVVGVVCDGKDMWRLLANLPVPVLANVPLVIDGEESVRVDGNQDGASVGLRGRGREGRGRERERERKV